MDFVDVIYLFVDEEFDDGDLSILEIFLEIEVIVRKKIWREIVCDDRFDVIDYIYFVVWDGKKSSKGFYMVIYFNVLY